MRVSLRVWFCLFALALAAIAVAPLGVLWAVGVISGRPIPVTRWTYAAAMLLCLIFSPQRTIRIGSGRREDQQ